MIFSWLETALLGFTLFLALSETTKAIVTIIMFAAFIVANKYGFLSTDQYNMIIGSLFFVVFLQWSLKKVG